MERKKENLFRIPSLLPKDEPNSVLIILLLPRTNLEKKELCDYMDKLLDEFFNALEFKFKQEFPGYIVELSQVKGSFHALIKKA